MLKTSGFSADSVIIVGILNGVASVTGVTRAVMITNRFRRRVMIIPGFCLMTFPRLDRAFGPVRSDGFSGKPHLILAFSVLFAFSMHTFIGPLIWLLFSEMSPLKEAYSQGDSSCSCCGWPAA